MGKVRVGSASMALVALLLGVGCSSSSDGGTGGDGSSSSPNAPAWLVGTWTHTGTVSNGSGQNWELALNADGSYSLRATTTSPDGITVTDGGSGQWRADTQTLWLGTKSYDLRPTPNCELIHVDGYGGTMTPSAKPTSCPFDLPPLTPDEKCVVGSMSGSNSQTGANDTITYGDDRLYREQWSYTSSQSGLGTSYQHLGYWTMSKGLLQVTMDDGTSTTAAVLVTQGKICVNGNCVTDVGAPGCDPSAFVATAKGACSDGSLYCGQNGPAGLDSKTLYYCENGQFFPWQVCSGTCKAAPTGTADACP